MSSLVNPIQYNMLDFRAFLCYGKGIISRLSFMKGEATHV